MRLTADRMWPKFRDVVALSIRGVFRPCCSATVIRSAMALDRADQLTFRPKPVVNRIARTSVSLKIEVVRAQSDLVVGWTRHHRFARSALASHSWRSRPRMTRALLGGLAQHVALFWHV